MKIQLIPPAFSWESQARQYAESGAPGLTLEQHMAAGGDRKNDDAGGHAAVAGRQA